MKATIQWIVMCALGIAARMLNFTLVSFHNSVSDGRGSISKSDIQFSSKFSKLSF